jgi:hypothetical protein
MLCATLFSPPYLYFVNRVRRSRRVTTKAPSPVPSNNSPLGSGVTADLGSGVMTGSWPKQDMGA